MDLQTKRSSVAPKLVLEPVRESSRIDSFPLAAGRYMIGASPECDIVISVGGVAPQHCLLIVGANKTVVKAISPLTWINDGPLTEAVLKHGERLILGPVELRTRRPEVSEWIERQEENPTSPTAPASYQPPQIEELLDHAREQLQTAIDEAPVPASAWSEDLPLAQAVQMHAAAELEAQRRVFEQQALEISERSRALEYLGTELAAREQQLLTREQSLTAHESDLQSESVAIQRHEQALLAQEHALEIRILAEATASRLLAERSQAFEEEQARVQQLVAMIEQKVPELHQQSTTLAERVQTLDSRDTELSAREAALALQEVALQEKAQAVHALASLPAVDTTGIQQRETAVAKREASLASSTAALQTSRDQITQEATQLEQRFAELIEREQSVLQRQSSLTEQAKRVEADSLSVASRLVSLEEREQTLSDVNAGITQREELLQRLQAEVEKRDRELTALRSELDIRDESLNQQFSQLQLDRSTLRSAQSKQHLAEQAANQRVAELDQTVEARTAEFETQVAQRREEVEALAAHWQQRTSLFESQLSESETHKSVNESLQQRLTELEDALQRSTQQLADKDRELHEARSLHQQALLEARSAKETALSAELEQQWAILAQERAEFTLDQRDLQEQLTDLEAERNQLEVSQQLLAQAEPVAGVIDRTEIDQEWQSLTEIRQKLESDRLAWEVEQAAFLEQHVEATSIEGHLQALLDERAAVALRQAEVDSEHHALRSDREETQRARTLYEQEQGQLRTVQLESEAERDTYLLERQTMILERQLLQDRERQIKRGEAEAEQKRIEAEKASVKLDFLRKQMEEQRAHLDEEWSALREERVQLKQTEANLDQQREELTAFAQQLTDLPASESGTKRSSQPAPAVPSPLSAPVAVGSATPHTSLDWLSKKPEPIATPVSLAETHGSATTDQAFIDAVEPIEDDEVEDPLAGFASFSSIDKSLDDALPPEIAEIIRRAGGSAVAAPVAQEITQKVPPVPAPPIAPLPPLVSEAAHDPREEQRLRDLLGRSSESFVDEALAPVGQEEAYADEEAYEEEAYEVISDLSIDHYTTSWNGESQDDEIPQAASDSTGEQDEPREELKEDGSAAQLRSRLSEMFGISLSGSGTTAFPAAAPADDAEVDAEVVEATRADPGKEAARQPGISFRAS